MSNVILVTGASTGFGRDTAETLAGEGHRVFASMRDIDNKNREHAEALKTKGIEVVELDVTNKQSANKAVDEVVRKAGRIDVLVNNAGVASAGVSEAFTDEQVTALFDVNVVGVHRVSRAVLPTFRRQQNGLIINIGSILGRVTFPFFGIYGASKFAVEALTDSLRYETSQLGIEVALVQPSAYPTNMYGSAAQPVDVKRVAEYGPIGEIPAAMFQNFISMFEGTQAPNPHEVAETIANLVKTPRGQRPARSVVGASFGADIVNDHVDPIQNGVLKTLELDGLERPKVT